MAHPAVSILTPSPPSLSIYTNSMPQTKVLYTYYPKLPIRPGSSRELHSFAVHCECHSSLLSDHIRPNTPASPPLSRSCLRVVRCVATPPPFDSPLPSGCSSDLFWQGPQRPQKMSHSRDEQNATGILRFLCYSHRSYQGCHWFLASSVPKAVKLESKLNGAIKSLEKS